MPVKRALRESGFTVSLTIDTIRIVDPKNTEGAFDGHRDDRLERAA
jgi:hypothetical protein